MQQDEVEQIQHAILALKTSTGERLYVMCNMNVCVICNMNVCVICNMNVCVICNMNVYVYII